MRIIDQNGHAVLFKQVHPALDLVLQQTLPNGLVIDAQRLGSQNSSHGIFHIKASCHADAPAVLCQSVAGGEGKALLFLLDVPQNPAVIVIQIGGFQFAKGQHPLCMGARVRQHLLCVVHLPIDNRRAAVLHQLQFAGKIVLKIGVLQRTDVVLADIQKHPDVKIHPVDPAELVRLRGNLHRQKRQTAVAGLGKIPLQIGRFRCGQVRLVMLDAGVHLHSGKHRALLRRAQLRVSAAEGVQNIFHKVGGGGLALGSGQTDHAKVLVCLLVKGDGNQTHRLADVADQNMWAVHPFIKRLGKVDACALCDGIPQVLLLKGCALADKKSVRRHIRRAVRQMRKTVLQQLRRAIVSHQQSVLLQQLHCLFYRNRIIHFKKVLSSFFNDMSLLL